MYGVTMIAPPKTTSDSEPKVTTGFRLNPDDIEMLDNIRVHFDFDNRSQAVRKAIRLAARHIELTPDGDGQVEKVG
jgi:hypothetical protein